MSSPSSADFPYGMWGAFPVHGTAVDILSCHSEAPQTKQGRLQRSCCSHPCSSCQPLLLCPISAPGAVSRCCPPRPGCSCGVGITLPPALGFSLLLGLILVLSSGCSLSCSGSATWSWAGSSRKGLVGTEGRRQGSWRQWAMDVCLSVCLSLQARAAGPWAAGAGAAAAAGGGAGRGAHAGGSGGRVAFGQHQR